MNVEIDTIKQLLTKAASAHVKEPEASTFADLCVRTHLKKSPRMNPLQEAIDDIKSWRLLSEDNADVGPDRMIDKAGVTLYNFNRLPPSLKIMEIHDALERKARRNGIAAAGIFNSAGIITLNMWAEGLAGRDLIGIAMFNGGTECCVPPGAKKGVIGTNPIAYAVPTQDDPMLLDMATTEIPYFDVKNAKEKQTPLKPGVALDQQGLPTTDAAQALDDEGVANLLPIGGGFKGYGIMLLIEVLTGSLVQSLLSTQQSRGWNPPEYGCFMIAIDVGSFTDVDIFKENVSRMCHTIRELEPSKQGTNVSIPGDRGHAKTRRALDRKVIEVAMDQLETLKQLVGDKR